MNAFLDSIGYGHWILHALLVIPLLGVPAIFLVPARNARWVALVVAMVELVVGLGLWWAFDPANPGLQFVTDIPWIGGFGIGYRVGIDGISLMMVLNCNPGLRS